MFKKILKGGITLSVILFLLALGPIDFANPLASLEATNVYGYHGGGGGYAPFVGRTTTTVPSPTNTVTSTTGTEGVSTGTSAGTEGAGEAGAPTEGGAGLEGITGQVVGEAGVEEGGEGTSLTGNVIGNLRTHAKSYSLLAMLILIIGLFILYGFYRKKDKEDKPSA